MTYFRSLEEMIGNTPMLLMNEHKTAGPLLLAKLDFQNLGGSSKDRIALSMIENAERKGFLKKGYTIILPTSGNTGIGVAMLCAVRGYKAIFTIPDKVSREKELIMRSFGAEVIRCPTNVATSDPESYNSVAERLSKEIYNSYLMDQYSDESNPMAHYLTTGPEIWTDTDGNITHFVCGIGTGGTITGVGKYLKEKNPNIKIIGVDPQGSLYSHRFYGKEGDIHQYLVEGIGEDFIPSTLDMSVIDNIETVEDEEAFKMCRKIAKQKGLLIGGSSGAVLVAAQRVVQKCNEKAVVVVFLHDTGRNYINKIFTNRGIS